MLTDATKFGRVALHRIVRIDEIHAVITDPGIGSREREQLEGMGVEVIVAEPAD